HCGNSQTKAPGQLRRPMDFFVLLTPFLLLTVLSLFGFVGCEQLFDVSGGEGAPLDPPTFQPPPAGYLNSFDVTITADSGDSILYSLSTDPLGSLKQYNGPISISQTTVISAYATDGDRVSQTVSATYVLGFISYQQSAESPASGDTTPAFAASIP